jgi:hypothetical protein
MALAPYGSASHNCGWLRLQAAQAVACAQIGSKVNFVVLVVTQCLRTFTWHTWPLKRFVRLSDFSYLLLMLIIIQDIPPESVFFKIYEHEIWRGLLVSFHHPVAFYTDISRCLDCLRVTTWQHHPACPSPIMSG